MEPEQCEARPVQEGGGSEAGEPGSPRSAWPPAEERAQALEDALGPGDWRRRVSPPAGTLMQLSSAFVSMCRGRLLAACEHAEPKGAGTGCCNCILQCVSRLLGVHNQQCSLDSG